MAAGRNPADLSREVEKVLAKFIRDPVVTIVVSGFQGTFPEQIRIVGEAARPQSVPYRQQMTVLDVMIQAGGLTDFADGNGAVLVRGSEGRQAVQRAAEGPLEARRHLRQRRRQARRHRHRAAELLLTFFF